MDKLIYERKYLASGCKYIAGIDEVGRGPLAGPVVCCALIMPLDDLIEGVDDSKKIAEPKREKLAALIRERAVAYAIGEVSPQEIDKINILNAVRKCMTSAVNALSVKPDAVLVDGNDIRLPFAAEYVVGGDGLSYTIGAASIVAKVYRDQMMKEYGELYPMYAFGSNKGYGTAAHIAAIREHGLCPIHRRSFTKNFTETQEKTAR